MRTFFLFFLLFNSSLVYSQQGSGCSNPIKIKTLIKGMNVDDSIISLKHLISAEELIAEKKDVQIVSFTATLYPGNEVYEFSVIGTKFSDDNRKWFSRLRVGDAVYFSNIKANIGVGVCLNSLYYRISE